MTSLYLLALIATTTILKIPIHNVLRIPSKSRCSSWQCCRKESRGKECSEQRSKERSRTLCEFHRRQPLKDKYGGSICQHGGVQFVGALRIDCPCSQVLLAVMSGAFGLAGFYFGGKPTSSTSEAKVAIAPGSMPWQVESSEGDQAREHFKYQ